ncbi:hypothetical protein ABZ595_04770 [Streptomyces rubradiris]|uniref:hypothetical protein n=1 Tax=Streptomyces rubradiris TaxID=285531 RepID=UPI0033C3A456
MVSGDDDFVVHGAVPDIERPHAFLMDRFSARREAVSFRGSVIYQQTSSRVLSPLDGTERSEGW